MKNILTGIRSTGVPHLGNILSVIIPSVKISTNNNQKNSLFIFIADLHSLIETDNIPYIKENVYQIAAAWLAFGLNTDNCLFYRQSDIPEVTELAWYLGCFFPYNRLLLSHSFKEKKNKQINLGLFTYPILMAADILLYDANIIPVGKDQIQHIEITRRIANFFNKKIKKKIFTLPNPLLHKKNMLVIGTDGTKMSKSKNNCINIFSSNEILKKQVMKIHTDNKSLQEKKNPEKDYIISLYKLIAPVNKVKEMENKYLIGKYGYFEAKMTLYDFIIKKFSKEREKFLFYINNKNFLDKILFLGAQKAKIIAKKKLNFIRKNLNFNTYQ
ncbi:tryptophan--tRNA ligase [Blattabacterium cuenoti]|uniref:tryptophan--tRNA ligase n=1 Tax=Blattabacterium cuenoti TaxID=1653831 RepID=UPI00163D0132|nr:tryptophan--tRNA ligase [Blattabacterium cuenoti]